MKYYIVFQCRKCEHLLFIDKINKITLKGLISFDCPECGEEGCGNWVLLRTGRESEMS